MVQVGEFATPTAPPLPQRFKRKGRRNRRTQTPKPITTSGTYEDPKRTVIDYRMHRYGLSEVQAKHQCAATELGRLWLSGRISEDQRAAGERWLELRDEMLRAIKAPVGLRKTNASGDGGEMVSEDYVTWAVKALALWAVFEMKGWPCLRHVIVADQPPGSMLPELKMALTILAKRFGIVAQLAVAT